MVDQGAAHLDQRPGCPVPGQRHDHRVATRLDNHGVDRKIPIANQQQAAISNDNLPDTPAVKFLEKRHRSDKSEITKKIHRGLWLNESRSFDLCHFIRMLLGVDPNEEEITSLWFHYIT